ncbi:MULTISPECIES: hypothetical protein [unclassified Exiguobacterium]|uniref:hypothetical protein n=1 Tax=unclassified Exiguobacterium TaxID=2644629 RepID=UPI001BE6A4EA|nr:MULTISPECIES: hypothetical protein [unclassified Exiguobacterium]
MNKMLNRINEPDRVLRTIKNEGEPYEHLLKQDEVIVDVGKKRYEVLGRKTLKAFD